jgi:type II secretory pathway pseudopilin PulG
MTLVELLIVITILVILLAATLPRIKPAMDKTRVRESARLVASYLSSARTAAMSTGRDTGVLIERLASYSASSGSTATAIEPGCAMTMSQVQNTPPYCGDSLSSTCTASWTQGPSNSPQGTVNVMIDFGPGGLSVNVYAGDMIQFNCQGYWYQFNGPTTSGQQYSVPKGTRTGVASYAAMHGEKLPFYQNGPSIVASYKIVSLPTKTDVASLQLPSPACIDLTCSGQDSPDPTVWTVNPNDTNPIVIMFSPNGSISSLAYTGAAGGTSLAQVVPTTPIYLLVGQRQNISTTSTPLQVNYSDFNNLWVGINPRSGSISVAEQAAISPTAQSGSALNSLLTNSRAFVRESDSMGGK